MNVYIFNADVFCADCAADIIDECRERGIDDDVDRINFRKVHFPTAAGKLTARSTAAAAMRSWRIR
jgi:hypothetical protein